MSSAATDSEGGSSKRFLTFMKYTSLVLLVAQNASVIIFTRIIRQQKQEVPFLATIAVLSAECIKFSICVAVLCGQNVGALSRPVELAAKLLNEHGAATFKCAVPALCYTIQNYLIYFSLANLEIVVFQLIYQSKLLIAAVLSIAILSKKLTKQNWIALVMLFIGLVIVQLSEAANRPATIAVSSSGVVKNYTFGCIGALSGSALSAFAGVYFEALLKGSNVGLWARNCQLCLFTIPLSILSVIIEGSDAVAEHGMFGGFTSMVWLVVALQAAGGLLVAVCLKYADNIIKNFASAVAIIVGGCVSIVAFEYPMSSGFALGGTIVLIAVPTYDPVFSEYIFKYLGLQASAKPGATSEEIEAQPLVDSEGSKN